MLTLVELFDVAFLFIWCVGTAFPHFFFSTTLLHMTTSTTCVQMKAR